MAVKKCPKGTKIQTVIFTKENYKGVIAERKNEGFTLTEARKWLKKHDFKYVKVDIKEGTYRFRQEDPSHFTGMKTIPFGTSGIKAVIGCPVKSKK